MDVMKELRPIGEFYGSGKLDEGLSKLDLLWDLLPEPKSEISNAYLIVEYGVAFSLKSDDLEKAEQWARRAPMFSEKRQDRGEVEFLVGKVAFASGDLDRAKEQFAIAYAKSEGRVFHGKDSRYRKLVG